MTRRLNWGCGPVHQAGWVNLDRDAVQWGAPDVVNDTAVEPLPFGDDSFDVIVANHSLQMVAWHYLPKVLREFRRVLASDGAVRVLVPDTLAAFAAYGRGEHRWFPISDHDCSTLDAKLSAYLSWWSEARVQHTEGSLREAFHRAGFEHVERVEYGRTQSALSVIVELDSRRSESLIVEAW